MYQGGPPASRAIPPVSKTIPHIEDDAPKSTIPPGSIGILSHRGRAPKDRGRSPPVLWAFPALPHYYGRFPPPRGIGPTFPAPDVVEGGEDGAPPASRTVASVLRTIPPPPDPLYCLIPSIRIEARPTLLFNPLHPYGGIEEDSPLPRPTLLFNPLLTH